MEAIMRHQIADYLNVGEGDSAAYALMGVGFNTLDENPTAKIMEKTYVSEKNGIKTTTGYATVFPFDTDLIADEQAAMALYKVGRDQKVGADTEFDYVRVELFDKVGASGSVYKARKFRVSVEIAAIAGVGGEIVKVTGNLNNLGDFIEGTFDTSTKTFTEASAE